ncbi:MAG: hypothetical protein LUH36_03770 [Oscillospiraceae bacterium]|nr:hypothetical protein [Oscillospiraceae bacterium]
MVILKIEGTNSRLTFHTDTGHYTGAGERLADGFDIWNKTIRDENGGPISGSLLEELISAVDQYTDKECPYFRVYFNS